MRGKSGVIDIVRSRSSACVGEHLAERVDEARVLFRETDRHPDVRRKAVNIHRADDHTTAEERLVDGPAVADVDEDEVRGARHAGEAEPVECRREIRHAGTVRRERPPDVVVGLFGLPRKTTRVRGPTVLTIAGRSCVKSRSGTLCGTPPAAWTIRR